MNEILQEPVALDHFVLGLDDEGNEVKIKIDEAGELTHVQDIEDRDEAVADKDETIR